MKPLEEVNEETVKNEVARQMRIISQGAAQIIGEDDLKAKLARFVRTGTPLTVKLGLDPSAPDIHLGHAVVLRKLKQMQDMGHHIVIIIGDFTGRIGDPTGKSKGRKALSDREIMQNAQTYQEQVFRVLDPEKTTVRYNGEWLELLKLEEILKLASTVTVARMLERDDFQNRYLNNTPIGLHEFFYPLMQAYDSAAIRADVEIGGTDQTFNILMGRSLQKDLGMEPQAALFMPILEGLDGVEKMSKSLGNYIGVQEEASVMFKKVMEVPDRLIRYFELTTDILPDELDKIKKALNGGENPRDCKMLLARTITALYHTPEETRSAEEFFHQAFSQKGIPEDIPVLRIEADAVALREPAHCSKCRLGDLSPLLVQEGFVASGSEFRRLLAQGGVRVNMEKESSMDREIADGDVLKIGKKKFLRICF